MTTMEKQIKRFNMVLGAYESLELSKLIPPVILSQLKGILFVRKTSPGQQYGLVPGIFMMKQQNRTGEWSLPVAVHLVSGTIDFENARKVKASGEKVDLLLLLTSESAVSALENMGQVGFDGVSHFLSDGPVMGGQVGQERVLSFVTGLSKDPTFVASHSFAYVLTRWGSVQGAFMCDALFQTRERSNNKFYENKNATGFNILAGGVALPKSKYQLVTESHKVIRTTFYCSKEEEEEEGESTAPTFSDHEEEQGEKGKHLEYMDAAESPALPRRLSFDFAVC